MNRAPLGDARLSHDARAALDRLLRVHGPDGLKAALLPWFERVLERLAARPLDERRSLLLAVRRLLTATGPGRPIDRLLWLLVRRGFGDQPGPALRVPPEIDIAMLPDMPLAELARYTAHLARMVPAEEAAAAGRSWYLAVMAQWQPAAEVPPCDPPDVDTMVLALTALQRLSWIQRPLLVRSWVGAALEHSHAGGLTSGAADALRLTCRLLDSPMPPELARHYIALPTEMST